MMDSGAGRVLRRASNTAVTTCGVGVQSWQTVLGGRCRDSVEMSSLHVRWKSRERASATGLDGPGR